jgi:hypothetical protein
VECLLVDFGLSFGRFWSVFWWSVFWLILECLLVECLLVDFGVSFGNFWSVFWPVLELLWGRGPST